jgi:ketosteroid isomerase-like protein
MKTLLLRVLRVLLVVLSTGLAPASAATPTNEALTEQVRATELAFAKSMAERDFAAFTRFVAADAVFASAREILRGRAAVSAGWKPFFDGAQAPFSWAPELVAVTADGALALSSGPVFNPEGKRVGTFKSTWRREKDGQWRVVIDSGCPSCNCDVAKP